jgi:predicted TIM-barrel fold metal-dependent hydrolase
MDPHAPQAKATDAPPEDVRLREFAPRSTLRVRATLVERPKTPVVDAHAHLGQTPFAGGWFERPVEQLLEILDEAGVETVVDLDGAWGDGLRSEVGRYAEPFPERFIVFAGIDYDGFAHDDAFGEREAVRLRESAAIGARGLKIWKLLGLRTRDDRGRLVPVDDPRLEPLWDTAGELGLPVLIHVGDPIAFFEPLDRFNERYEELLEHPDWHFWPTRPAGQARDPGFPPFDEIMSQFRRLVEGHPGTTFIGAHVGCAAEDLGWVSSMLDACQNYFVDVAARLGELGRQPYSARDFFIRHQDRIVFGTDGDPDLADYRRWYRFLETRDEYFAYGAGEVPPQGRWAIHGIGLPDEVLAKVYRDNARRLLGLPRRAGPTSSLPPTST